MSSAAPLSPPHEPSVDRPRWTRRAVLAAWLAVNLVMLGPDFRGALLPGGRPVGAGAAALLALPSSLVMTAAAWAAFRLTRRYTLGWRGLGRSLAVHAAAALGLALLNTGVRRAVRRLLADPGADYAPGRDTGELAAVVVVYAALAILAHALEYARRYRERRLAELRLQASLARAELEGAAAELRVLTLQLNPHFLFNALHAVSALVHHAPDAAERMVVRLGDLLRHARGRAGTQEVPLDEEVRTLEPFLEVERIRMDGRLRVEWEVEPGAGAAYVPHMVLQPLVENAIKHGLAGRAEGGCVRIQARRHGPWLELAVRDDGAGMGAAARGVPGAGIGTANTRARLSQLYGAAHAMEMVPAEGGGTRVSLRIPWHTAPIPSRALSAPPAGGAPLPAGRGRWVGPALAAALFLFFARRAFAEINGMRVIPGRVRGAAEAVVCGGVHAALLTLLFSAAFVLARRAPIVSRAALGVHACVALPLAVALTLERYGCSVPWGTPASVLTAPSSLRAMALEVAVWMGQFAAFSLLAHALEYARRARATEAAGLRLQASLARAELQRTSAELRGLRMQVNPGFLLRALGAVASRVHAAPGDAERMVVRLADLLRHAMAGAGAREVPLEEEIRALEPFLEVERIRRGGRLRVSRDVDDDALDALVPALLLQPLVVDALAGGGDLGIAARRRGGWLEVEVRGGAASDATSTDGVPVAEDASADDVSADGVPADRASTDGVPGDEDESADGAWADRIPADGTSADRTSADRSSTDGASADGVSAEDEGSVDDHRLPGAVNHPSAHAARRASMAASRRGPAAWIDLASDGEAMTDGDGAEEARARLAQAYGGGCTVERAATDGGGTRTRLRLPWHEEPWAAPASASPTPIQAP